MYIDFEFRARQEHAVECLVGVCHRKGNDVDSVELWVVEDIGFAVVVFTVNAIDFACLK